MEKEDLWKSMKIYFRPVAREFPDNTIYASVDVKPESARKLIEKFILFVDEEYRNEFGPNYRSISISGFDTEKYKKISVKKTNVKKINVQIKAIPINNNWEPPEQESDPCHFFFSDEVVSLSPVINFKWMSNDSNATVVVNWHHIGDKNAQKYVVCLDNKEIHYINPQLSPNELKTCSIHHLEPGSEHTIQIISKLNNGKVTHRSDLIDFTVPKKKDENNKEVLFISPESIPSKLLAFIDIDNGDNNSSSEEPDAPKDHEFRKRAIELLRKLQHQIENRDKF